MKILITGAWKHTEKDISSLKKFGYDCVFHQNESEPIPEDFYDVDGIVCNGLFLHNDARRFKNLKFVQLTSAGLDRAPIEYFNSAGIKVLNAAGVYSTPIAEFVISSVLDLLKKKFLFYENQRQHKWIKQRDLIELNEKTVCIIGCGNVGKECARLFKSFNCRTLGVDLFSFDSPLFDSVSLIEDFRIVLQKADIVVLTLPLTNKTHGLFDSSAFENMKNTAILVNVSRGGVVKTSALVDALRKREISAAILDVFETEPLEKESVLWSMPNVLIYPHNSFIGDGNGARLSDLIMRNLKGIL